MGEVADKYPELFHYTTVDAFESIYESGSFWATHYEDLNDLSELQCFRNIAKEHAFPLMKNICKNAMPNNSQFDHWVHSVGGIENAVRQELDKRLGIFHMDAFGERGFPGPFICSFCAHKAHSDEDKDGLLSQWRGYGTGGGVAIVLDTLGVEKRMKQERNVYSHLINHIGNVIYDRDIKEIKERHRIFFDLFEQHLTEYYRNGPKNGPKLQQIGEKILEPFVLGSTLVKHHGFREEGEVRIVVSPEPTDPSSYFYEPKNPSKPTKAIKYRRKGEGEARYIELFGIDDRPVLPIERVIVGPSRIQNLNYQKIRELTSGSTIDVTKSEIPFLG